MVFGDLKNLSFTTVSLRCSDLVQITVSQEERAPFELRSIETNLSHVTLSESWEAKRRIFMSERSLSSPRKTYLFSLNYSKRG